MPLRMTVTRVMEEMMMTVMRESRVHIKMRMIIMLEMRAVTTVWLIDPLTDNVTCSWGLGPHLSKSWVIKQLGSSSSTHKPEQCQITK